jgi:hypothetical protein
MMRPLFVPALLVAFSLVAQEGSKPAVAATKLSLQSAIETSLKNNLQVQIAAETRDIGRAGVAVEEGAFDWNLTAGLSLSKAEDGYHFLNTNGSQGLLTGTTFSRALTVGSTKAFGWGGNLSLSYAPRYSFATGSYYGGSTTVPYDGSVSATYTQSLLRNFGRDVTERL